MPGHLVNDQMIFWLTIVMALQTQTSETDSTIPMFGGNVIKIGRETRNYYDPPDLMDVRMTFPIAFPTGCIFVTVQGEGQDSTSHPNMQDTLVYSKDRFGFNFRVTQESNNVNQKLRYSYIAIGY